MKGTVGRSQLGLLTIVAAAIWAACALMLVTSTQATAQATAQPLLEYKFEEGSGNTATNTGSRGTAANGNIGGGATYSTDTPTGTGTGYSLDFFGGRVEVPPVCDSSGQCSPRHGQDQVTVEAWIKPDTFGGQRVIYDDYGNPGVLMTV